jgi:hypothetical protein
MLDADFRMRTMLWIAVVIGMARVCCAGELPRLRGGETARATDLLRAERMAEEAEKRRRLPGSSRRHGWLRGGAGWSGARGARREEQPPRVTIRVSPSRRAARDPSGAAGVRPGRGRRRSPG